MKSQIVRTSRGEIEYTLRGSGPVVLHCHGTSSDCFSTCLADPLLQAGFSAQHGPPDHLHLLYA